jgi:hypothetical protein
LKEDGQRWHKTIAGMKGISEETTTGCASFVSDDGERRIIGACYQRERLGNQIEV